MWYFFHEAGSVGHSQSVSQYIICKDLFWHVWYTLVSKWFKAVEMSVKLAMSNSVSLSLCSAA